MHYGSFTVTVEAKTEEELEKKMAKLCDALSLIEEETGIEGFVETENTWED